MAYTTIKKPSDYFNTKLYNGTGSSNSITGINFQPDFTWIKRRNSATNHHLHNAISGATKVLYSNSNVAESTDAQKLSSFDSDGFTVGTNGDANNSAGTFVSWNWKANGAGVANTDGSRATTVSINTTAGFSVGTCSSLATNNDTLGHGLGAVPKMIIVKNTQAGGSWWVYHASLGNTNRVYLNGTEASGSSTIWNNTTPTSSVFTMKGGDFATGESLVFYAFAEKQGYSKFGSYTGNGNADGTFVYTGFKPAFLIAKRTDVGAAWVMYDSKRDIDNPSNHRLLSNANNAELVEDANTNIDFLSNGFKTRNADSDSNASGGTYIYMAFAEEPLVGDNPATAR